MPQLAMVSDANSAHGVLAPAGGVLWEFLGGDVPLVPWNP